MTTVLAGLFTRRVRGLAEELALREGSDFSLSDNRLPGFGLDTARSMCGLPGFLRVTRIAREVMQTWQSGVKNRMENKKLFAIPVTPQSVCDFVFTHGLWQKACMGISSGREQVNSV